MFENYVRNDSMEYAFTNSRNKTGSESGLSCEEIRKGSNHRGNGLGCKTFDAVWNSRLPGRNQTDKFERLQSVEESSLRGKKWVNCDSSFIDEKCPRYFYLFDSHLLLLICSLSVTKRVDKPMLRNVPTFNNNNCNSRNN